MLTVFNAEYIRLFSKIAPNEGGLETGGMEYLQDGGKHGRRNATERQIHYRYFGLREQLVRVQKGKEKRQGGQKTSIGLSTFFVSGGRRLGKFLCQNHPTKSDVTSG